MRKLANESAFAQLRSVGDGKGVIAAERFGLTIASVIARKDKLDELGTVVKAGLGLDLPIGATWAASQKVTFIGIGPGKWLAIDDGHDPSVLDNLEAKIAGLAAVVEQSGGIGVLRLTGPALFETLEKGVQIDLATESFPSGSAAVTSIAKIGATLWKIDDAPTFDIAVARSLVGSFLHWLESSASARGLIAQQPPT